jgi:ribonucleoside-diphosphate reductase beta chain
VQARAGPGRRGHRVAAPRLALGQRGLREPAVAGALEHDLTDRAVIVPVATEGQTAVRLTPSGQRPPPARGSSLRGCYGENMADQPLWERVVAGHFVLAKRSFWPNFFSQIVARLQWNPMAIDLSADAAAWPKLPPARGRRLLSLLAGFCVAEDAVAEQLTPFADAARGAKLASQESLMAWVFFLQRRDEQRHAKLFDRIGAEVLGLPGVTAAERREAARAHVTPAMLELFEQRLPDAAAKLAAGDTGLAEGVGLYHMLLEGVVFDAGQRALLDDLSDGALPGVREGVARVERDERWHVGFGLRCLIEARPSADVLAGLLEQAEEAAAVWGDAVPAAVREQSAQKVAHRLHAAGLIRLRAAA